MYSLKFSKAKGGKKYLSETTQISFVSTLLLDNSMNFEYETGINIVYD